MELYSLLPSILVNVFKRCLNLICILFLCTTIGEMSVLFLFVTKVFKWTYTEFGLWSTYRFIVNLAGAWFSKEKFYLIRLDTWAKNEGFFTICIGLSFTMGFVSYYLKVSDAMVGILGCASQVAASFVVVFSVYVGSWMMYAGKL